MMKKFILFVIFFPFLMSGCEQQSTAAPLPTSTVFPANLTSTVLPPTEPLPTYRITETPKPTQTWPPWPTIMYDATVTPDPRSTPPTPVPSITAPPPRNPPVKLPHGLEIEEYKVSVRGDELLEEDVKHRHLNHGGWYFWPHGGMLDNKLFEAQEKTVDLKYVEIHATLDNQEIFMVDCGGGNTLPTLITAWVYQKHWIIQSVCHQQFDIFWDGVSLNATKNYQSSFAFQLLGQKPFYLYKLKDEVWLSYDGEDVLLGYDNVKLTYCCMNYRPPQHYENLITFYATKNDQLYYVAIGLFDNQVSK